MGSTLPTMGYPRRRYRYSDPAKNRVKARSTRNARIQTTHCAGFPRVQCRWGFVLFQHSSPSDPMILGNFMYIGYPVEPFPVCSCGRGGGSIRMCPLQKHAVISLFTWSVSLYTKTWALTRVPLSSDSPISIIRRTEHFPRFAIPDKKRGKSLNCLSRWRRALRAIARILSDRAAS